MLCSRTFSMQKGIRKRGSHKQEKKERKTWLTGSNRGSEKTEIWSTMLIDKGILNAVMFIPETLSDEAGLSNGIQRKKGKPHKNYTEAQTWQANVMETKASKNTLSVTVIGGLARHIIQTGTLWLIKVQTQDWRMLDGAGGTLSAEKGKADKAEQRRNRQKKVQKRALSMWNGASGLVQLSPAPDHCSLYFLNIIFFNAGVLGRQRDWASAQWFCKYLYACGPQECCECLH